MNDVFAETVRNKSMKNKKQKQIGSSWDLNTRPSEDPCCYNSKPKQYATSHLAVQQLVFAGWDQFDCEKGWQ